MGLSPEDVERLDDIVKRARPLHRGDLLFRSGDRFRSLFVVKTGSVKSFAPSAEGGEQVLGFHLPGEIIGLDAIERDAHACSAKVLETSAICEIPFPRLEELTAIMPSLQHQMFRLLSKEIGHDTDMLLLLGKKSAEERLAAFLLSMSKRLQKRGLSATDFYLSMSRHEIGNYLGLAVETVSPALHPLPGRGLMRVDRKHIQLHDADALETAGQRSGARPQHSEQTERLEVRVKRLVADVIVMTLNLISRARPGDLRGSPDSISAHAQREPDTPPCPRGQVAARRAAWAACAWASAAITRSRGRFGSSRPRPATTRR